MYLYTFCTQESQAIISFLRKAMIMKLCLSLKTKNKKQKTPTLPCFSKIQGCVPSQTDMTCCFFGTYTCTHGVNSAKNIVSCPSSFRLLQQNITDWVVFEQKFIVHGSGAWKSEMRTSKVGRCSSSGAQTSHHVLTWWISVGSLL